MQFFCPMQPPTTTAQMHQVSVVNGKPHFYDPPEVAAARAKLLSAICQHMPPAPMDGAVSLLVKWCFPAAGGHRDGEYRTTKPDCDNLQKLLKDVMSQCGFWRDDAQVCREIVEKFWANIPGIYIRVEAL
ncbi:MAG: RusA family crossover junction endodeoxyribonuclease [Candidatus Limiplasma sp.]|nr:RusA family crossover junction endodeoxyribonuclease [Candidatus Limiplasma sp.]MEA5145268.1 RusA family crossover junction endodeoxyribonuclease [Candidatus Limiplasma sp.]